MAPSSIHRPTIATQNTLDISSNPEMQPETRPAQDPTVNELPLSLGLIEDQEG